MSVPRVSIIIPCYNHGAFIEEALNSVYAQTFTDYELIVVNDGSTDPATNRLLGKLADNGLKVLQTSNRGPAAARNEGISRCRGKYVLPLDADDRIAAPFLEQTVGILDRDPEVGVVYSHVELFGLAGGEWPQPEFSLQGILFENMIVASAVFRRSDWERVGGYSTAMMHGWEDWDFWLSLVALGRTVVRLPEKLFFYRIRQGSRTERMTFGNKLRMYWNLVVRHKGLYCSNYRAILRHLLRPSRRMVASPREMTK
jgi:glycosyltransferase involved in cell wall biosynthesis